MSTRKAFQKLFPPNHETTLVVKPSVETRPKTDMIIALLLLLFWIIYRQSRLQNKQIAGVLYNFPDEIVFKVKSNDIGRSMISFLITEMEVH